MPQIFINGELIGGSDIVMEMYESGELQQMISDGKSE
jgi:monothiol glutaredoxin